MHRHYRDYMPAGHIVKDFHLNKQNAFIISKHESKSKAVPSRRQEDKGNGRRLQLTAVRPMDWIMKNNNKNIFF